jgi:glyoxylase-like metal-dependent hydrolase (beta-lactamase superfamily II)
VQAFPCAGMPLFRMVNRRRVQLIPHAARCLVDRNHYGHNMAVPTYRSLDPDAVEYGRVDQVSPLIRRVIAKNPSKFTYLGTGTYVIGHGDVVVVDPGPRLDSHRDALAAALATERVRAILITHCHADHSPLAAWLSEQTGAPTIAYGPHPRPSEEELNDPDPDSSLSSASETDTGTVETEPAPVEVEVEVEETTDYDFVPTIAVADGDVAFEGFGLTIRAVYTPGHTSNHTCFAFEEESALFTGDHVMGWSTTVVSAPDGDMAAYIESLRKVAARADAMLWPTHGPPREDGVEYVQALIAHRLQREAQIMEMLAAGHHRIADIVEVLYADVRKELHKPARRSVQSHLIKLVNEGAVAVADGGRALLASQYHRV